MSVYFAIALGTVTQLVTGSTQPRATASVFTGVTVSTTLGLLLVTFAGTALEWQWAFHIDTIVVLAAAVAILFVVPRLERAVSAPPQTMLRPLANVRDRGLGNWPRAARLRIRQRHPADPHGGRPDGSAVVAGALPRRVGGRQLCGGPSQFLRPHATWLGALFAMASLATLVPDAIAQLRHRRSAAASAVDTSRSRSSARTRAPVAAGAMQRRRTPHRAGCPAQMPLQRGVLNGMADAWVPWLAVGILGVAVAGALLALWLHRRQSVRSLEALRIEHARHLDEHTAATARQAAQAQVEQDRRLSEQSAAAARRTALARAEHAAQLASALEDRDAATAQAEQLRVHAARSLEWELTSRAMIAAVCQDLSLSGVLATNIVFVPTDSSGPSPFVAQIDHVLLTEHVAVVIEHKRWRGVVFDGVLPSSVHPAFAALLDESALRSSFAVQIAPANESSLTLRTYTGAHAPTVQVRAQTKRLAQLLRSKDAAAPWFDTCVLYSHREAIVFAPPAVGSRARRDTAIAADREQLRRLLARLHAKAGAARDPSPVDAVVPALETLGADLLGLGDHAPRWPDLHP